MTDEIAYLQGTLVAASDLSVSVRDQGFVLGVTVSERLRTFGGKLFRLVEHLRRLKQSLEIIGLGEAVALPDLAIITEQLVTHNLRLLDPADDLGVCMCVTPGDGGLDDEGNPSSTVCVYTYPLPFRTCVDEYTHGSQVVVSGVQQVPTNCWPAELKCRSRMHYYLADREAARQIPGARAILLDDEGHVSEASTANVLLYREGEGLISPCLHKILPGISLATVQELAAEQKIDFVNRDVQPNELQTADEVLLCSTSPGVWSVTHVGETPVGDGLPGPVARQLLQAWSERVGIDIPGQARAFAAR